MSLARYLCIRGTGIILLCAAVLGSGLAVSVLLRSGPSPTGILALLLGLALGLFVTPLAFSRRARVVDDSFVPPILPFPRRFGIRTLHLSIGEISEIRNRMAGPRLIGLVFTTEDGETYLVLRNMVGKRVFDGFLDLKQRFYSSGNESS